MSARAALLGGAIWALIPIAHAIYPWGDAGDRAYGHLDYALFAGPLLFTVALPEVHRFYRVLLARPFPTASVLSLAGALLLTVGAIGYGYGRFFIGGNLSSAALLLPLLALSAGFTLLGGRILRSGLWSTWPGVAPIASAAVPLIWLLALMFAAILLCGDVSGDEATFFFETSFDALIALTGLSWCLLGAVLRKGSLA